MPHPHLQHHQSKHQRVSIYDVAQIEAEVDRRIGIVDFFESLDGQGKSDMWAFYAENPVDWINDWCVSYDPRAQGEVPKRMPFNLWPAQISLVEFLEARRKGNEDGGVKKSRDWGGSYVIVFWGLWLWIFHPDTAIVLGSRKEALVDKKGDTKALFTKIRMAMDELHQYWIPDGFDRKVHDNHLILINPQNGSTITGEAGDEMGRGNRASVYIVDEAAFIKRADQVDAAIGGSSECVIYLSTSGGMGTLFYQKEISAAIPFFFAHWRDDPRKDDEWKEKKIREKGPVLFAREYNMDDGAAVDWLIIPAAWVQSAVSLEELPKEAAQSELVIVGLDVADEGADESVCYVRNRNDIQLKFAIQDPLPEPTHRAINVARTCDATHLFFDRVGIGAGAAQTFKALEQNPASNIKAQVAGIKGGSSATNTRYCDDPEMPAHKRFKDLNAEMWWHLRIRLEQTHRYVEGEPDADPSMVIKLPNIPKLISQLSSRQYSHDAEGRVVLQSKKDMRKKGVASPDHADAVAYTFAPARLPEQRSTSSNSSPLPSHLRRSAPGRNRRTRRM